MAKYIRRYGKYTIHIAYSSMKAHYNCFYLQPKIISLKIHPLLTAQILPRPLQKFFSKMILTKPHFSNSNYHVLVLPDYCHYKIINIKTEPPEFFKYFYFSIAADIQYYMFQINDIVIRHLNNL